jgi:predicted DNA binding protein
MGTIVEVVVPTDEFVLRGSIETLDSVQFQLERVVAQSADHIMPFVWVTGPSRSTLERAFDEDPTVDEYELVTDLGDQWLYQLDWVDRIAALVQALVEQDAVLLEAQNMTNTTDQWGLTFLFLDRDVIRPTLDEFDKRGITVDTHGIYDQREGELGTRGLTAKQHGALSSALEKGYYEVPRRIPATDLAAELDVSHQAFSERLRRAHRVVVTNALGATGSVVDDPQPADD